MHTFLRLRSLSLATALLLCVALTGCGGGASETASNAAADTTGEATQASAEGTPKIETGMYTLDSMHSNIGFRIRHLGISMVEGNFKEVEATLLFPSEDLTDMQVRTSIPVSSINTNNEDRDNHLRSGDFFNAKDYPTITFNSTNVTPMGGGKFEVTGDLTMKDSTQTVTLEGEYMGATEGPDGFMHAGIEASGKIDRQDFGLTWSKTTPGGELVVGDDVTLMLNVEAIRQGPADMARDSVSVAEER